MRQMISAGVLLLALTGLLPLVCLLLPSPGQPVGSSPGIGQAESPALPQQSPAPGQPEPLLIWDSGAQLLRTVEVEEYLIGAAACEMPYDWPPEAIKAQMAASHSWALYCRDHRDGGNSGAYFTACPQRRQGYMTREVLEAYWGEQFQERYDLFADLAREVASWVVTYEGQPAGTFYHAISTGTTTDSGRVWNTSLPYLSGVDSPWDAGAPDYQAQVVLGAQRVHDCLVSSLGITPQGAPASWLGQQEYDPAGYCTAIDIQGQQVSGIDFRTALGLRSAAFSYEYDPSVGEFTFTTLGYGHGVGMSQWGARALALEGKSWQEILAYYFPGTQLTEGAG